MLRHRRLVVVGILLAALSAGPSGQSASRTGANAIRQESLKEWLTYLASDELQGRATYTEGLGMAAQYIAEHLKDWGVKPAGDNGTYFQIVKVLGVRTTSRSSVTVEVNGEKRTFADGQGVTFPRNMGASQTLVADSVQFAGYGLSIPAAKHDDYASFDPKGRVVIWLGPGGPSTVGRESRRLLAGRSRLALERGAIASIGPLGAGGFGFGFGGAAGRGGAEGPGRGAPEGAARGGQPAGRGAGGGRGAADDGDFTTVQRLDHRVPPAITASDEFFEFLFSGSEVKYAELKQRAEKREALPAFALSGVKLTVDVNADYEVTRTRFTRNVVGIVEGSSAALKDTYVVYGAHYDHTGYREGAPGTGRGGPAAADPADRINNGADDDGSGTVALMGLARAFAMGPKPKRSVLFVWHAGEESGLLGSRYNADHPVVPLEKMVAQINIDMIGRNRNDDPKESNTVYVVGSDRISTELHNINEDANAALPKPLTLDYEWNDPADPESFYTRSDHYSYAAKGIPVIFYFTGTHADYHRPSDTVDKILFEKLQRITRLAYETGRRVANLAHMPVRDNKGPRVGMGWGGRLKVNP